MKLVLGNTPQEVGKDGEELPTPAAIEYIADNLKRPSFNTLPPNEANAGLDTNNDANISF